MTPETTEALTSAMQTELHNACNSQGDADKLQKTVERHRSNAQFFLNKANGMREDLGLARLNLAEALDEMKKLENSFIEKALGLTG